MDSDVDEDIMCDIASGILNTGYQSGCFMGPLVFGTAYNNYGFQRAHISMIAIVIVSSFACTLIHCSKS